MKFLHFIIDNETGNQIETIYSDSINPKFSLECMSEIEKFTYKIWNRETNEITIVK